MVITNNNTKLLTSLELSIQISLSGLSFCILNRETNTIQYLKHYYKNTKLTPFTLLDHLKHVFNTESVLSKSFNKVIIIHENALSTFVPKTLFNENNKTNYLKFNTKILSTDFIAFDELTINESINVYVPYININNFIFDNFGEFDYKHHSSVLVESILQQEKNGLQTKVYLFISPSHFEVIVTNKRELTFYNTFEFQTKEDFIYYLLFTLEQLNLNPETIEVLFLGVINENNELFKIAYKYIRNVSFGKRNDTFKYNEVPKTDYSDYTLIKSL